MPRALGQFVEQRSRGLPFGCGLKSETGNCPRLSHPHLAPPPACFNAHCAGIHQVTNAVIAHLQKSLPSLDAQSVNKGADPHRASGRRRGKGYVLSFFYPVCTVDFSKQPNHCGCVLFSHTEPQTCSQMLVCYALISFSIS